MFDIQIFECEKTKMRVHYSGDNYQAATRLTLLCAMSLGEVK